jgi:hypothetical protein
MKSIGIKLADGSFYPVVEEGAPAQKTLDLTTAHDNQTTVMVDLYRSETGTMEDAEYVDTLQIDNLIAHPNGEPDLSFNISLDENKKLSAAINDPESGEHSDTTITLVSRTLEERMSQSDFSLSQPESGDEPEPEDDSDAGIAAGGLLAAAAKKRDEENTAESGTPSDDGSVPEPPDFSDLDLPEDLNLTEISGEPDAEKKVPFKETSESAPDNFTEPDVYDAADTYEDTLSFANNALDDVSKKEADAGGTTASEESAVPEDSLSGMADFNDMMQPENSVADQEQPGEEHVEETNFDMPDFDTRETEGGKSDAVEDNVPEPSAENFSLPDFDEIDSSKPDTTDKTALDDFFSGTVTQNDATQYVKDNTPSNGIKFDGLYDKETEEGGSSAKDNSEVVLKKKTKMPVLICIICALVCVVATLLILFIIPSKYNLITMHAAREIQVVNQEPQKVSVMPEVSEPEEKSAPAAPEAKEDEVVVAPAAQAVAPEKPAEPAKKPADIVYRIKWGDTLWDIADAYYKNPWRYHRIARYNRIRNPDYIISGTTIKLPAE